LTRLAILDGEYIPPSAVRHPAFSRFYQGRVFVQAAAMAETICPARLIVEVQFPETQTECPNYLDNQLVALFGAIGTFSHFFSLLSFRRFYLFESYAVSY
jgi:hypothetical protein